LIDHPILERLVGLAEAMRQDKSAVIAKGKIDNEIDATKDRDKQRNEQPLIACEGQQPITQHNRPAKKQPCEGIDGTKNSIHQP
jgi:hypothetical protein